MKKLIRAILLALAVAVLAGCVQTETVVKVKPDGSGTLEQTVKMNRAVAGGLRSAAQAMVVNAPGQEAAGEKDPAPVELWKEADIRAQAGRMGEGVKFEKMEMLEDETFEGYRAVFSFADVNNLLVNQDPGESVPSTEQEGQRKKGEFIKFKFAKGKPSTLTVVQPERAEEAKKENAEEKPAAEAEKPESDAAQEEMMMAMMKMMLEGMKVALRVEVEGSISETNAAHREGSKVTIFEMDFDRLMESAEGFEKFVRANPGSVEESKSIVKDIPGIKIETEREITIKFE